MIRYIQFIFAIVIIMLLVQGKNYSQDALYIETENPISQKMIDNSTLLIEKKFEWGVIRIKKTNTIKYVAHSKDFSKKVDLEGIFYFVLIKEKNDDEVIAWQTLVAYNSSKNKSKDQISDDFLFASTQIYFEDIVFNAEFNCFWIIYRRGINIMLVEVQKNAHGEWEKHAKEIHLVKSFSDIKECKFIKSPFNNKNIEKQDIGIMISYIGISNQECVERGIQTVFWPYKK